MKIDIASALVVTCISLLTWDDVEFSQAVSARIAFQRRKPARFLCIVLPCACFVLLESPTSLKYRMWKRVLAWPLPEAFSFGAAHLRVRLPQQQCASTPDVPEDFFENNNLLRIFILDMVSTLLLPPPFFPQGFFFGGGRGFLCLRQELSGIECRRYTPL